MLNVILISRIGYEYNLYFDFILSVPLINNTDPNSKRKYKPFEKITERDPMGKSILPNTNRFKNSCISQLFDDFFFVEESWTFRIVRFNAPYELRRTRYHSLQQIHQGITEIRSNRLLGSRLRCQSSTRITFLHKKDFMNNVWVLSVYITFCNKTLLGEMKM